MRSRILQELFESAQWGILVLDESGCVVAINSTARKLLDLDPNLPDSGACQEMLRDHPALARLLLDALKAEDPPGQVEITLQRTAIRKQVISGWVSRIRDQGGIGEG